MANSRECEDKDPPPKSISFAEEIKNQKTNMVLYTTVFNSNFS